MSRVEALQPPVVGVKKRELDPVHVNEIVLRHYDQEHFALRRFLLFTGIDDATAEEIVQETFLKLQKHLANNGDSSDLRSWLYRVARNLVLNEHTSARRRRTLPLDTAVVESASANSDSPEVRAIKDQREACFRTAMSKLSPPQRDCLLLRSQGMKYREIAGVLGISIASVGENVQRGLERLKELL